MLPTPVLLLLIAGAFCYVGYTLYWEHTRMFQCTRCFCWTLCFHQRCQSCGIRYSPDMPVRRRD